MPDDVRILTPKEQTEINHVLRELRSLAPSNKQSAIDLIQKNLDFFQSTLFLCDNATSIFEFATIAYSLGLGNYAFCCFEKSIELYEKYYNKDCINIKTNILVAKKFMDAINERGQGIKLSTDFSDNGLELKAQDCDNEEKIIPKSIENSDALGLAENLEE